MTEAENIAIMKEFVAAWTRLDADELAAYFTEAGKIKVLRDYFNMPTFAATMS